MKKITLIFMLLLLIMCCPVAASAHMDRPVVRKFLDAEETVEIVYQKTYHPYISCFENQLLEDVTIIEYSPGAIQKLGGNEIILSNTGEYFPFLSIESVAVVQGDIEVQAEVVEGKVVLHVAKESTEPSVIVLEGICMLRPSPSDFSGLIIGSLCIQGQIVPRKVFLEDVFGSVGVPNVYDNHIVEFTTGSPIVSRPYVNDIRSKRDIVSYVEDGRIMAPVREIYALLACGQVTYAPESKYIYVSAYYEGKDTMFGLSPESNLIRTGGPTRVRFHRLDRQYDGDRIIDTVEFYDWIYEGGYLEADMPPVLMDGRLYVPLEWFDTLFDYVDLEVTWLDEHTARVVMKVKDGRRPR